MNFQRWLGDIFWLLADMAAVLIALIAIVAMLALSELMPWGALWN